MNTNTNAKLLTKRHQLMALRITSEKYPNLKIGASYVSLLKYESHGIVRPPQTKLRVNGKLWRFYNEEEIRANVERVIAFKKANLPKTKTND